MASIERNVKLYTGALMPNLGLGTWLSNNPDDLVASIHVALDAGYRHIDTAFLYQNEDLIGKALKKVFSDGKLKREDLFITTKLPNNGHEREKPKEFLQKSLEKLQLDYVDLFLIHTPVGMPGKDTTLPTMEEYDWGEVVDHLEVWKGMEDTVDAGMTKAIGLSNFNSRQIQNILDNCRIKPANIQVECHAYLPQYELFDFCKRRDITFTAYAPFGSPGYRTFKDGLNIETKEDTVPLFDPALKPLCEKHKKTPAQILLRWLIQRGMVVIPKSTNPQRIKQNGDIYDFNLSDGDIEVIRKMNKNKRYYTFVDLMPWIIKHPNYPFHEPF